MIKASLVEFLHKGILGPFHSKTTRVDLLKTLGPTDSENYPEILVYGHLGFDLAETENPLCKTTITYPH